MRKFLLIAILLVAGAAWADLPVDYQSGAYGDKWESVRADGGKWDVTGEHVNVPGWILVPSNLAALDSDLLRVDGGTVRLATQVELDAVTAADAAADAAALKLSAFASGADSELQLIGLTAFKARLQGAGKDETKVDADIAALTTAITDALKDLP